MSMYNGMRVLGVMFRKGGVGKTTFSSVIAQEFGLHGAGPNRDKRVLLLDMDTQQNLSSAFLPMEKDPRFKGFMPPLHPNYDANDPDMSDWDGRSSSADIFSGKEVFPYPVKDFPFLDILPAVSEQLQDVEMVRKDEVREKITDRLRDFFMLREVQEEYGLIIVDTPPGEGAINRSVLRACTDVIIPAIMEEKSTQGLVHILEMCAKENAYREEAINILGIVPNLFDGRYAAHHAKLAELQKDPKLNEVLADFIVRRLADFPRLDATGVTPATIFGLPKSSEARIEAETLCSYTRRKLYGEGA